MKKYLILLLLLIPSLSWGALVPAIEVRSANTPTTTVEVGEEVYFSASGTTYEDSVLLGKARYEWDFDDGYTYQYMSGCVGQPYYSIMAGGIAAVHYFMTPGTYTVTLSAKIWDTYTATNGIPQITSTSVTSNTIEKGEKTFTVETGKTFTAGTSGKIYVTAATSKYVAGTITSYNSETGVLVMDVTCASSTGTYDAWTVTFDTAPVASDTETVVITVTGEAPMTGFEIQRANYNNRRKQYLYIQIPPAHRATTTKLKVSLIGATTGTTVLRAASDNLAAEEVLLFDQSSLAADHYVVQAELLNASDERLTGGLWRDKFYKDYSGVATVSIDENNSLRVNDVLYFPITPFLLDSSWMPTYRDDGGINTLQSEGYNTTHNSTSWGIYLNQASSASLMAMGPGRGNYAITFAPSVGNSWKRNHNPDTMEDYVTANKDNSAMFAWLWQDEVNLGGSTEKIYPPTLAAWQYISKTNDQQHPFTNMFVGSDWSRYYGTGYTTFDYLSSGWFMGGKKWVQDIIGFDTYPVTQQLYPIQNVDQTKHPDMGTYAVFLDAADRFQSNNKNLVPYIAVLQPCGGLTPQIVSSDQVYAEAWMSVIHGAKGISWFNYFQMSTTGRWIAMKKFATQIQALKDVVLSAPPERTVTDTSNPTNVHSADYDLNRVDTMIREDTNYIYVFAVRITEPDPANSYVSVTLTGTPGTVINDGQISDTSDAHVWNLPSTVTIGSDGTVSARATCVDAGYITATPATLTKIVTAVEGWTSVTHTQNATPGSRYQGVESATLEDVQFTVSGITDAQTVAVVDESRNVSMSNAGVFTDDFDKNAVHIYKIPKSGSPPTTYTITVTNAGAGSGTVNSSPSGITCGSDCTEDVVAGNTTILTATPNADSAFDGWSGTYGCTGTGTCTVSSIAANAAVTATFSVKETPPVYHTMTVSHVGTGSGVTDPVAGEYSKGEATEVSITATANTGNTFTTWGGTCGCTGSTSPCTISSFPTSDCTVTAEFTKDVTYTVDVTVGEGISDLSSDTGVHCSYSEEQLPCTVTAASGSTVVFSVVPESGWYDCVFSGCTGSTGSCEMTENKSLSVSCTNGNTVNTGGTGTATIASSGGGKMYFTPTTPMAGNLGTDNLDSTTTSLAARRADCWAATAPISGTLTTAYVAHANTSAATGKVCVYSNDGDSPDAGDVKLGCSGEITSSAVEWKTAAMDGGTVSLGMNYYICLFIDDGSANAFSVDRSSTNGILYYKTNQLFYDTPGDTLYNASVGWTTFANSPIKSVYVTITP